MSDLVDSVPRLVLATILAGSLAACPRPSTPDAGTCGLAEVFVAEPRGLTAEGEVRFAFARLPPTDDGATLSLFVEQADGGIDLGTQPLTREASWVVPLVAGEVNVQLTLTCAHAQPAVFSSKLQVYPRVELTGTLPRACQSLSPAGADALDCDGVVVKLDGGQLAGRLEGASRSFWADGGWGRWVQTDAGLNLETTFARTAPVQMAPTERLVVTDRFAFSKGVVVRSADAGLVASSLDAGAELDGPDFVPCAASVEGGREWVAWCLDPLLVSFEPPPGTDPFVVCELVGASFTNCSRMTGVFVGQDVRTREVVLRRENEFVRFALGQRPTSAARLVRPGEATFRAPTTQTGDGRQGRMYRGSRIHGFLLPAPSLEPFVVEGVRPEASSELAWEPDEDAGVTHFTRLRPP